MKSFILLVLSFILVNSFSFAYSQSGFDDGSSSGEEIREQDQTPIEDQQDIQTEPMDMDASAEESDFNVEQTAEESY